MISNNKPQATDTPKPAPRPDEPAVFVYATLPSRDEALTLGRAMVEARVAGCINVLPAMTSIYVWEGNTEMADEAVLIAKLPAAGADAAIEFIKARHSYQTPAILVLPIVAGFKPYLDWLAAGVDGA